MVPRWVNQFLVCSILFCAPTASLAQDEPAKAPSDGDRTKASQNGSKQAAAIAAAREARIADYVKVLEANGLKPTESSITTFIRSIELTYERSRRLSEMFANLGNAEFSEREAAMRQIRDTQFIPQSFFDAAVQGKDLEVRWRAKMLVGKSANDQESQLYAVLYVVDALELNGLAGEVIRLLPFCAKPFLREQLLKTFRSTVTSADEPLIRSGLKSTIAMQRYLSVGGLDQLHGMQADVQLVKHCKDADDGVRYLAARSLIDHGNHEGLDTLVRLLESRVPEFRSKAFATLRHISGDSLGYSPIISAVNDTTSLGDSQREAVKRWQTWLAVDSPTLSWATPLKVASAELGRILCCGYSDNKVYEMDLSGKVLWEQTVAAYPWGCHGLPNGHRLLGSYREKRVTEYDGTGRIVWEMTDLPGGVSCVWRLASGNTLVTCTDCHRVMEISPEKKVVWDITLQGRPTDARRLGSGNTLVTLQNAMKVVEVDPTGKVIWELNEIASPLCAQRLDSGNTLVCSTGKSGGVIEVDSTGKTVWSAMMFNSPWCVQRLENGNTLVTDIDGLSEITPAKKKVWFRAIKGIGKLHRY